MPRQLTQGAVAASQSLNTDVAFIMLLTITPVGGSPLRFCGNNEQLTSRGDVYEPIAFDIELPSDSDEIPRASITLDAVEQELVDMVRDLDKAPTVALELVTSLTPDIVELAVYDLELRNVQWDAKQMTAELASHNMLDLAWPADAYTPHRWPGLF